tara:strand:- start:6857 stop:7543 length:687 start_codon:yes stop_codon:yes gene_type:complete
MTNGNLELRDCPDIGMFAWDRPINDIPEAGIEGSCIHATDYCKATCYNVKLYKMYSNMTVKDIRNENAWQSMEPNQVAKQLNRKLKSTARVRGCTRGENIKDVGDVYRIANLAKATPNTDYWIPVRAWRDPELKTLIEEVLFPITNVVVNASTDPTTSKEEWDMLEDDGWSIMFYGDDEMTHTPKGSRLFDCPKTGKGIKGHCQICKAGCFKKITMGQQSFVKLHQHT